MIINKLYFYDGYHIMILYVKKQSLVVLHLV
jgi:hypothetical protein